jgi:hypothetical protein
LLGDGEKDLKSYPPGASHARRASIKVRGDLGTGSGKAGDLRPLSAESMQLTMVGIFDLAIFPLKQLPVVFKHLCKARRISPFGKVPQS